MTSSTKPVVALTEREQRFVDEFVKDENGTAAYRRANPHVSMKSANSKAAVLRKRPHVQAAIAERLRGKLSLADITPERVLKELGRLAFFDPRNVMRAVQPTAQQAALVPGRRVPVEEVIPLSMLDEDTARAISEIEVTRKGEVRVRFPNKSAALEQLLRALSPAPFTRNPVNPVAAGANKVDHETLDEGEIDAIISEVIEAEASDDDVVEMGDDGEMLDSEDA